MAPLKVRIKYGSSELTNAIVSAELGFWIVLGERYAVFFNCSISSPKIRCSTILWEAASPSNLATMRRPMRDRSSRDLSITCRPIRDRSSRDLPMTTRRPVRDKRICGPPASTLRNMTPSFLNLSSRLPPVSVVRGDAGTTCSHATTKPGNSACKRNAKWSWRNSALVMTTIRQWSELGKSKDEASSSAGIIGSPLHDSITRANQMPTLAELKSLRNSQVMRE